MSIGFVLRSTVCTGFPGRAWFRAPYGPILGAVSRAGLRRGLRAGIEAGIRAGLRAAMAAAVLVATLSAAPPPALAGPTTAADAGAPPAVFTRVRELRLANGMLFLLLPRHDIPTVSGRIWFRVGNVDCPAGESGIAHLFEHMAFKGTDRIGTRDYAAELTVQRAVDSTGTALAREVVKRADADTARIRALREELARKMEEQSALTIPNEYAQVYDGYTFDYNAWTSPDFTCYMTDVPSNNLEVWMLMESERIQHPSFREFYSERDIVMEERRMRDDDDPASMAEELLYSMAYAAHPYRVPVGGYMSDLEVMTQGAAEAFRGTYYVPGNAVAALVGDFDPEQAAGLIRRYFGDIPAGPLPPEVATVEPPQCGMRRAIHRQGTERALFMAFPGAPPRERDAVVAKLLADVLSRDETSRLDQRLTIREKAVRRVSCSPDDGFLRYPGLFKIQATPLPGFTNEQVEAWIWEELDRVVREPVTAAKLREIQSARRKAYYRGLDTNASLADVLAESQSVFGDWRKAYDLQTMESITPEEVTALAARILTRDHATVVYLEPAETDTAGGPPGEPGSDADGTNGPAGGGR